MAASYSRDPTSDPGVASDACESIKVVDSTSDPPSVDAIGTVGRVN